MHAISTLLMQQYYTYLRSSIILIYTAVLYLFTQHYTYLRGSIAYAAISTLLLQHLFTQQHYTYLRALYLFTQQHCLCSNLNIAFAALI